MSRMWWIIILVGAGVAAAVVIGVLGTRNETSKTDAVNTLCSSVKTLNSSVKALTGLDSSTATKTDYENSVTAVQNSWNQVQSDAQAVQDAPTGDLDSAWNSFSSSVKNVPDSASASDAINDVTSSAQALGTAAQSTASQLTNCTIT